MTAQQRAHRHEIHPVLRDRRRVTRLYVERRLSLSAIAKKLGVCNVTVLRNLERHGIERRPCGGRIYHDAVFNPERVGPLPIPKSHRYWLAAIIDGEGWIGAVKMKNGPKTADVYYYGVSIGNTCRALVERVQALTGCGTIFFSDNVGKGNRKPKWDWRTCRHWEVKRVLATVAPLLIAKRRQAETVLSAPPVGVRAPHARARIHAALAILNHRGRVPGGH